MKSPMNMGHSAAKMAPNKMKSPAKAQLGDLDKDGKMSSYETKRQNAIEKNMKGAPDKMKSPMEMKEPMKMKSPMKMGSAYKLDKSGFKLKSAPVNMRTPGSVAKMAGVSPMKNLTPEVNVSGGKKNVRTDVTKEYSTKGNKSTRDHIKKGGKVHKNSDGSLSLSKEA